MHFQKRKLNHKKIHCTLILLNFSKFNTIKILKQTKPNYYSNYSKPLKISIWNLFYMNYQRKTNKKNKLVKPVLLRLIEFNHLDTKYLGWNQFKNFTSSVYMNSHFIQYYFICNFLSILNFTSDYNLKDHSKHNMVFG